MNNDLFKQIADKCELGNITKTPERIFGGLLHISYRLETEKGVYVIKLFECKENFDKSIKEFYKKDELEQLLKKEKISAVYALEFNGKCAQVFEDKIIYIFPWFDGKAVKGEFATKSQCKKMAKVTAKIHNIEIFDDENAKIEPIKIDWNKYIKLSKGKNKFVYSWLSQNLDMLIDLSNKANEYLDMVPKVLALCHSDMDCKNVLWSGHKYKLIDFETLGYANPYLELFKNALVWSGYEEYNINIKRYKYFLKTYFRYSKLKKEIMNFEAMYYASAIGIEWLEKNVKRALELTGENEEIKKLGESQIELTINQIRHFYNHKDEIIDVKI